MKDTRTIGIVEVLTRKEGERFVDVQFSVNADQISWVPPLKSEVRGLISKRKNPWFDHAVAAFFIASRDGRDVGRISVQIDSLWLQLPPERGGGPGCGNWGMFEAEDEQYASGVGRSSGGLALSFCCMPVPGQKFRQPVLRDVSDAGEYVSKPCLGIDVVELCCGDQAEHESGALTAAV